MLKKISLTIIASAILLIANTKNTEDISCEEQFESCILKCEDSNNDSCIEKCELLFDQCLTDTESD